MKMKGVMSIILLMVVLSLVIVGCGGDKNNEIGKDPNDESESTEKISLKYATYRDQTNSLISGFWMFIDKVKANDSVELNYVGGPEAIPAFDQFTAIKNGVIDFAIVPTTYYTAQIQEIIGADASMITPVEERENGTVDLLNEIHNEYGVEYLGKATAYIPYNLYLNKEIDPDNPSLKGMTIRIAPVTNNFVKKLGASVQVIPPTELYTALERGVVDGYTLPAVGGLDFGFNEVTKYKVGTSFYQLADVVIFNLDSWNKLPEKIKDEFIEAMTQAEKEMKDDYLTLMESEEKAYEESGVEIITLTPTAAEKFLKIANDALWEEAIEASPDFAQRYREKIDK